MAWTTPSIPITGQLITAGFWSAQIPGNMGVLKTSIADDGSIAGPLKGYHEAVQVVAIAAGVVAIDFSLGNHVTVALNANVTAFTVTNMPASGKAAYIVVYFTADGTPRTVTHTINTHAAKFSAAAPPAAMTATAGKIDTLIYSTLDGGATWLADVTQNK